MKLALLEPHHHTEILYNFCDFLNLPGFECHIFTWRYIGEEAKTAVSNHESFHWHHPNEHQSVFQLVTLHQELIDSCDKVIILTWNAHFKQLSKMPFLNKTCLIIHNQNAFFEPFAHLHFGASIFQKGWNILRLARNFLNQRQVLQRSIAQFWVSETLEQSSRLKHHKIQIVPFSYCKKQNQEVYKAKEPVKIVVPGTVDLSIRNYDVLENAVKRLKPQLNLAIAIILLGFPNKAEGKQILQRLQALEDQNIKVTVFLKRLPQRIFEEYLRHADFLILPFQPFKPYGPIREIFGQTTISGSISDMISSGLPALISSNYHLHSSLLLLTHQFQTAKELARLVADWIQNKKYVAIKQRASKTLDFYTFDRAQKRLLNILLDDKAGINNE